MCSRKLLFFLPVLVVAASCNRDPKAQAQRYLDNGNKFFARERFKEASIMYQKALLKDLKFGEAYYRLGLTDLKTGAYGHAIRMLRRAVELQPNNIDAEIKLADLYLLASTQDKAHVKELRKEAEDLAKALLSQNPDSYEGLRITGQMALLVGDTKTAIPAFERANQIKPYQPDACLPYFQSLVREKRSADAEKLAYDLIAREKTFGPMYDLLYLHFINQQKTDQAEQVLKMKIENNPKQASNLLQLAGHYFLQKRIADMDAVLKKLTDEQAFPQGHLMAGDFFFYRIRQFDRAEQEYQAAIKTFPKDKAVYQKRLVEMYAITGKSNNANNLLATILKDNPKDSDALAMRAALQLTTGNRDQIKLGVNELQSLVSKTPNNHLLRFNLARGLVAIGEIEQARLQLEEAIKLRPDFVAARETLARVFLAKAEAAKALKEADEIIAIDPNNGSAHLIRSSALLSLNDRDKARDELDLVIRQNPNNPDARYQVGYLAFQDKDYKKAEQIFGALYHENPTDVRALVGVAEVLAAQKRMEDAIQEVNKAIAKQPDRKPLQLMLAKLLVRSNRFDDGIAIFQRLANAEPKDADMWIRLGSTYRLKNDLNGALECFKRASELAPNDQGTLLQIGLLMEETGKRDQARPIYERILKINPNHAVALNNLAYIRAEEGGDLDQALSMAQRALQNLPSAHEISDTVGLIYIKKALSQEAVRVLDDLVKLEPSNPTFRFHLAMALQQKGDKPRARKEAEEALRNKPSTDVEKQIRSLLTAI